MVANTYNVLDVTLAAGVAMPDVDVTRNFYTTSSCGVCGKASLEAVRLSSRHCPGDDPSTVAAKTLTRLPALLRDAQKVFASTGGYTVPRCSTPPAPRWRSVRTSAGTTPSTR